jgi:beta-galactosidase
MLDGDPATGWSNGFSKAATALLPAFGGARAEDWVSVDWGRPRTVDRVEVSFTVDATHSLPGAVTADVFDGRRWRPVTGLRVDRSGGADAPTVVAFDPVRASRLRLTLTSARPGEPSGAVRISRLAVPGVV